MLILVSGGAGSGKSEYAEQLLLSVGTEPRVYLATMKILDDEDRARVLRHRTMRRGKGFKTIEALEKLEQVSLPPNCTALLECLSNLCANECFGPEGFSNAEARIWNGLMHLESQADLLVIVTNELFSDGIDYAEETVRYLTVLANLNCRLAQRADRVYEVVCGIPILWKGKP